MCRACGRVVSVRCRARVSGQRGDRAASRTSHSRQRRNEGERQHDCNQAAQHPMNVTRRPQRARTARAATGTWNPATDPNLTLRQVARWTLTRVEFMTCVAHDQNGTRRSNEASVTARASVARRAHQEESGRKRGAHSHACRRNGHVAEAERKARSFLSASRSDALRRRDDASIFASVLRSRSIRMGALRLLDAMAARPAPGSGRAIRDRRRCLRSRAQPPHDAIRGRAERADRQIGGAARASSDPLP